MVSGIQCIILYLLEASEKYIYIAQMLTYMMQKLSRHIQLDCEATPFECSATNLSLYQSRCIYGHVYIYI